MMCCKLTEKQKMLSVFFHFFLQRTPQTCQPNAERALSMGGLLEVCVMHHLGHAIIFVGCGDCP